MEQQSMDLIENNFLVRNSLVSNFEQLLFLVGTLNQNDKKHSNSKTTEVNKKLKTSLNELILKLWNISDENNYYWHNCSTHVYKVFYHTNKENLIKTYGKRRFYRFLENELNSFLKIEKTNNPKEKLYVSNVFFQDAHILLDYEDFLDTENILMIDNYNFEKIEFLKNEVEKDNYYVDLYDSYFKIKKVVNRFSSNDEIDEYCNESTEQAISIENVNIINIDDKAFPLGALKNLLSNLNNIETQNKEYDKVPEKLLKKKGLPNFNVLERFELFKLLGGQELFDGKIEIKNHKNLLLGISMDLSPDTAKKLQDGTYSKTRDKKLVTNIIKEAKNKVQDYLEERDIKIQN